MSTSSRLTVTMGKDAGPGIVERLAELQNWVDGLVAWAAAGDNYFESKPHVVPTTEITVEKLEEAVMSSFALAGGEPYPLMQWGLPAFQFQGVKYGVRETTDIDHVKGKGRFHRCIHSACGNDEWFPGH